MIIKLKSLKLNCKQSEEIINFSDKVTFFHGQISSGKSSIVRLVDFCMGGGLERTPAILRELVSVQLLVRIEKYDVLLEREAHGSNQIRVSWKVEVDKNTKEELAEKGSVLAPTDTAESPIWNNNIFSVSDLLFYFLGKTPIKVRKSKKNTDSPLIRLSFRDIMWYCYLEQDNLDSSFFRLEDTYCSPKSRDVMRFILGYYTEEMNDLEIQLEEVAQARYSINDTIKNFRETLKEFGYKSEEDVSKEVADTQGKFLSQKEKLAELRNGYNSKTHFADRLRQDLRNISAKITNEEQSLMDLEGMINDQKALHAELLATKFKLARLEHSSTILTGVPFEKCPCCGQGFDLKDRKIDGICYVCKKPPVAKKKEETQDIEIINKDLDARIDELADSIEKHKESFIEQKNDINELYSNKNPLEERLRDELENYDSNFLADSREAERNVATLEERLRGLEKISKLPNTIKRLEEDLGKKYSEELSLKEKIKQELAKLKDSGEYIKELEDTFLNILCKIGLPGISADDKIVINRKTWIPSILTGGNEALKWNFYNAGSGGKKTLFNSCYALALHIVTSIHNLPLPRFLIIDTPMKNIGEEVNKDLFISFYNYIYELSAGILTDTQFIIVDKDYIKPKDKNFLIIERYMTPDKKEFPPLISYYRGP